MDEDDRRSRLESVLGELDWHHGQRKAALVNRLASDEPLRHVVALHLVDGIYFSPRDVLAALPERAWHPAADEPGMAADLSEATDQGGAVAGTAAAGRPLTETAAQVADRIRVQLAAATHAADRLGEIPERMKQTADRARDQVISIRTRAAGPESTESAQVMETDGAPTPSPVRRLIPVALSAVIEGLGQAYNRQPAKAAIYFVAGASLSTASGLNTWLVRGLLRDERVRIGPERVRPFVLGLWSVAYLANLWDAWSDAGELERSSRFGVAAGLPRTWSSLDARRTDTLISPTDATEELPAIDV